MTTLIVASTMARARVVAAAHDWPRSTWSFVKRARAVEWYLHSDLFVDVTAPSHPDFPAIAEAIGARLNPTPGRASAPSNLPQFARPGR